MWWTEYRRSLLFEQRVDSQLCYLDLADGKAPHRARSTRRALPHGRGGRDTGVGRICARRTLRGGGARRRRRAAHARARGCELHGLAWEERSQALYVLATDDSGMWLGRMEETGPVALTRGAYVTLSDLRAGQASSGSGPSPPDSTRRTASTPATGRENARHGVGLRLVRTRARTAGPLRRDMRPAGLRRITCSPATRCRFPWSLAAAPQSGQSAAQTLGRGEPRHGALLSRRLGRPGAVRIACGTIRKVPTLVKFHSWMPVSFDPFALVEEHNVAVNIGATLVSQNLLSNAEGFVSYGWNRRDGSLVRAALRYFGLGVQLRAEGAYGGRREVYALEQVDPETGEVKRQHLPAPGDYYSVGATAILPLVFQRGYRTRQLSLSARWNFSNGMVANVGAVRIDKEHGTIGNIETIGFRTGLHKLTFGAVFSDAGARRTPRLRAALAWQFAANYARSTPPTATSATWCRSTDASTPRGSSPTTRSLSRRPRPTRLRSAAIKLPSGQRFLSYKSARLIPRGFDPSDIRSNNYLAVSVDYQFPLLATPRAAYPRCSTSSASGSMRAATTRSSAPTRGAARPDSGRGAATWCSTSTSSASRHPPRRASSSRYGKPSGRSVWVGAGFGLPF